MGILNQELLIDFILFFIIIPKWRWTKYEYRKTWATQDIFLFPLSFFSFFFFLPPFLSFSPDLPPFPFFPGANWARSDRQPAIARSPNRPRPLVSSITAPTRWTTWFCHVSSGEMHGSSLLGPLSRASRALLMLYLVLAYDLHTQATQATRRCTPNVTQARRPASYRMANSGELGWPSSQLEPSWINSDLA